MTGRRSRVAALASAGLALIAFMLMAPPVAVADTGAAQPAAGAAAATTPAPAPVVLTLISTSPIAPPVAATDTTVTVLVSVTNNTDTELQQLQLRGVRDSPIIRQSALDQMLAHPVPPVDASLTQPMATTKYAETVAPHTSQTLEYDFPASSIRQTGGVCLCQSGIYPIDLTAYAATSARASVAQVGWTQTYLVSVAQAPVAEGVSWLWPLIDRPHRSTDGGVFTDDALAAEVEVGGRLDRALQVLEQVGPASRITVVIDPELIDELAQMSGGYRVQQGTGTVAGTGSQAAAAWLERLRRATSALPIALTPYADPAVNAVAAAQLTWNPKLPAPMATRVETALGRLITPADSQVAWPPGETLTSAALTQVIAGGASTIVLNDSTLTGGKGASPAPPAVATLPDTTPTGAPVNALVTSSALEQQVSAMLDRAGSQLAGLSAFLAELALPTIQDGAKSSYLVLTPDRYVDATPAVAAALITSTTSSVWTTPVAAASAAAFIPATDHGALTAITNQHDDGNAQLLARAATASAFVTEFGSALAPADVPGLLGNFPMTIQLGESAGWATDETAASAFDAALAAQMNQLTAQVQIVRPSNGAYSLASSSAPLLVTVVNNLPVPVNVRISMSTVGGVAGFRTDDTGLQVIPANSRRTIKVQAHVARSGHFRVQAQLFMPAGAAFGAPLQLSIYSSALGTIGVIITVVAAAVLLLALINRFVRRWRHHRNLIHRMMTEEQLVPAGARR